MHAVFVVLMGGILAPQAPLETLPAPEPAGLNDVSAAGGIEDEGIENIESVPAGADPFSLPPPAPAPAVPRPANRLSGPPPVPIIEIPPSPAREAPSWEAAFAPETWPVWSLAVIGLTAAVASLRMVVLLRRQIRAVSCPRLYIDGIRFTGLVAGSRPVFFVRIANTGPADAHRVTVTIGAVYQGGGGKAGAPQTMTIPAYSSREFFVRWQNALTSAVRDDILGGSSKLCVKVTVRYGDGEPEKHCFQYQPWDSDRPSGLPDFIPCDLDSQLDGFATGRSARVPADDITWLDQRQAEYVPD